MGMTTELRMGLALVYAAKVTTRRGGGIESTETALRLGAAYGAIVRLDATKGPQGAVTKLGGPFEQLMRRLDELNTTVSKILALLEKRPQGARSMQATAGKAPNAPAAPAQGTATTAPGQGASTVTKSEEPSTLGKLAQSFGRVRGGELSSLGTLFDDVARLGEKLGHLKVFWDLGKYVWGRATGKKDGAGGALSGVQHVYVVNWPGGFFDGAGQGARGKGRSRTGKQQGGKRARNNKPTSSSPRSPSTAQGDGRRRNEKRNADKSANRPARPPDGRKPREKQVPALFRPPIAGAPRPPVPRSNRLLDALLLPIRLLGSLRLPSGTVASGFAPHPAPPLGAAPRWNVVRRLVPAPLRIGAMAVDAVSLLTDRRATMSEKATAVAGAAGGAAGGWAGGLVGAKIGAALGTMILPGVGTIVGGLVGSVAGGLAGSLGGAWLGRKTVEAAVSGKSAATATTTATTSTMSKTTVAAVSPVQSIPATIAQLAIGTRSLPTPKDAAAPKPADKKPPPIEVKLDYKPQVTIHGDPTPQSIQKFGDMLRAHQQTLESMVKRMLTDQQRRAF